MDIKYVGDYFKDRFSKLKINNNSDLIKYMKNKDSKTIKNILEDVFVNKRKKECVYTKKPDKFYEIRVVNKYGYNSTILFLKKNGLCKHMKYIRDRPFEVNFPKRCNTNTKKKNKVYKRRTKKKSNIKNSYR